MTAYDEIYPIITVYQTNKTLVYFDKQTKLQHILLYSIVYISENHISDFRKQDSE